MTVLFRCRIEKRVLDQAERVAKRLGSSTSEMVRIFVTQMARSGGMPLDLSEPKDDPISRPWQERAARLESFYDSSRIW
jgi:addiction module RelB/DinJ family antitoxin